MPRVFIPQYSRRDKRIDISDLRRYGTMVLLFEKMIYPDNVDHQMPLVMERARDILRDFDPGADYLALVGSPVYIAVCSLVLGERRLAPRLLRFDRIERGYYPIDTGAGYDRLAESGRGGEARRGTAGAPDGADERGFPE